MEFSDGSRSLVVRVWRHGDETVARLLVTDGRSDVVVVRRTGRDDVLEWIGAWLDRDRPDSPEDRNDVVTDR